MTRNGLPVFRAGTGRVVSCPLREAVETSSSVATGTAATGSEKRQKPRRQARRPARRLLRACQCQCRKGYTASGTGSYAKGGWPMVSRVSTSSSDHGIAWGSESAPLAVMRLRIQVANREVYGCKGVLNPPADCCDAVRSWS